MPHIHILLIAPLGAGHMAQSGADQHEGRVPVRESPHHPRAAADLPGQTLGHVVHTDACPMFYREFKVGQRLLNTGFDFLDRLLCFISLSSVITSLPFSLADRPQQSPQSKARVLCEVLHTDFNHLATMIIYLFLAFCKSIRSHWFSLNKTHCSFFNQLIELLTLQNLRFCHLWVLFCKKIK